LNVAIAIETLAIITPQIGISGAYLRSNTQMILKETY
jgi:hypothetical protein